MAAAIVAANTAVSTRLQARTLSGLELLSGDMARSEAREMVDCVISQMCETLRARNLTRDPTQKIGGAASARCGDVIHEECRAIKPTSRDAVALEEDHKRSAGIGSQSATGGPSMGKARWIRRCGTPTR